ncbi:MAG TPA: glutamine amidotransferase [Bryobacteraceae bacterium]|nr:glutamine amidotransferase [Bryobacteraceae bacterium]
MFEFLFKYPAGVFSKGNFVLLGSWPRWILYVGLLVAGLSLAASLAWRWKQRHQALSRLRTLSISALQWATLGVLLFLLWEPAISVTALRPQQNIVAVVVDDSRSMSLQDGPEAREKQAVDLLNNKLLKQLQAKFQVRLYRLGASLERVDQLNKLNASEPATQIGRGLGDLAAESATLPIGSVVLLSDGSDNGGGIDSSVLSQLKDRRLPVNTIGFGKEKLQNDVELDNVELAAKALPGSRMQAQVTIRQDGFSRERARLVVNAGGTILANREITLRNAPEQVETVEFNAGKAGVENVEVRIDPLPGETNTLNNRVTRILSVDNAKRRILYIEGEPRWEFKFLRRAAEDDPALQIVSMLRTTQNKIYRQGISNPEELAGGFPTKPEDLFAYQGLILGSVESAFFTSVQQQLIKEFVDRRGGGLLFLGGRWSLSDGGYNVAPFPELLPVNLPRRKNTFQRSFVAAELTDAGKQSTICRIEEDPEKSADHWEVLPYLANYQDPGTPKPGAQVLANVNAGGKRIPLLVTENYGRGRTAVMATAGTWRWRMQQPVADKSQETFWRQLLRWQAGPSPSEVTASSPNANLADDDRAQIRAEVRDKAYLPVADADVSARIIEPDGSSHTAALRPDPTTPGIYAADWTASQEGSYVVELSAFRGSEKLGADVLPFHRQNGVAENFHREQNRDLLERLAQETGGRYYTPQSASKLPDEIAYSEAGITSREMKDLWNMPAVFILLLALRSAEWLLRRRWGVV